MLLSFDSSLDSTLQLLRTLPAVVDGVGPPLSASKMAATSRSAVGVERPVAWVVGREAASNVISKTSFL